MIEEDLYDIEWLIACRFPEQEAQIRRGDFKILVVKEDGKANRTVVRFPNTTIFAPNVKLIDRIFMEIFCQESFADILIRSDRLVGLEITTKE